MSPGPPQHGGGDDYSSPTQRGGAGQHRIYTSNVDGLQIRARPCLLILYQSLTQ